MAHILIVDDDPLIIALVERSLRNAGYAVDVADNGQSALEFLSTRIVDLVITDVMMPVLDGWTFIRELRTRPNCAFLPVIFLTALDSADDRIRGFRLGADDYLAKPFKPEELLLRVERTLRNGERIHRLAQTSMAQPIGFEGALDQVGFSSLLILLEMERKTGELILSRNGQKGSLQLRNGKILNAAVMNTREGAPHIERGAECIYYLLKWSSGRFHFTPCEIKAEDEVVSTTTALLMEGARRLDEKEKSN